MSSKRHLLRTSLTAAALVALAAVAVPVSAQTPDDGAATRMYAYEDAAGIGYFAITLTSGEAQSLRAHDYVVLFDTSASQAGEHREAALAALAGFTSRLGEADRVRLYAVDIEAVPLSDGFVAAGSGEFQAALAALEARTPLGATDMEIALDAALNALSEGEGGNDREIVYIGDGMSAANLVESQRMRDLVDRLVAARVPVSSYAVGPQLDVQLLGVLATQTGGVTVADDGRRAPRSDGEAIAEATRVSVFYPRTWESSVALGEVHPTQVPPLRHDREVVLVGRGSVSEPFEFLVRGERDGEPRRIRWQLGPASASPDNAVLSELWAQASRDDGLSLALSGPRMIEALRNVHFQAVERLLDLGERAVALRELDQAEGLAAEALRLDPGNPDAAAIRRVVARLRETGDDTPRVVLAANLQEEDEPAAEPAQDEAEPAELPPVDDAQQPPAEPLPVFEPQPLDQVEPDQQPGIPTVQEMIGIRTQQMVAAVRDTIARNRALFPEDPTAALDNLKIMLQAVEEATDIDPAAREQLRRQLTTVIEQLTIEQIRLEHLELNRQQRQAAAEAQQQLILDLIREEEALAAMMARFTSLMNEENYLEAERVAREAQATRPEEAMPRAAVETAEIGGNLAEHMALRLERQDMLVETLQMVERSHIPFPDEPPLLYPPVDTWRALTERRRQWESVDLASVSPREQRIRQSLNEVLPVPLEFNQTPLRDVLNFIGQIYEIQIVPMEQVMLDDLGISTDEPVSISLSGITLRSALRLLLESVDPELTYVIQDEVMKITTVPQSDAVLETRVYPVADLVVPVTSGGVGGLGLAGALGQTGGIGSLGGGGFGGGGFGGGGFGGGGFGGGGFGGGGGFFNIAPPPRRAPAPEGRAPQMRGELQNLIDDIPAADGQGGRRSPDGFFGG